MRSEHEGGGGSHVLPLTLMASLIAFLVWLLTTASVLSAQAQTPLTIRIEMTEFAFAPSIVRIPKGRPVRLLLVNHGQIAHQFETDYLRLEPARLTGEALYLEVNGLDILRLQPGSRARVQFTPRRGGRFPFACTIEGHQEAGGRDRERGQVEHQAASLLSSGGAASRTGQ